MILWAACFIGLAQEMRRFEKIFLQTGLKWNITQICILFIAQNAQTGLNWFN